MPLWKRLAIMVVSGAVGATTVIPLAMAFKSSQSSLITWAKEHDLDVLIVVPSLLAMFVGCFIAAVAAHEFGHVIAGLRAGFRFAFVLFWPIQIRRRGQGGISVKTMFRSGLGLGGIAGMTPEPGTDLRRGYLTLLAGGPLSSFVCGVLGLLAYFAVRNGYPFPAALIWTFGLFSLLLFLISMTPSSAGGFLSDGAAIRLLRKGTPEQVGPYVDAMEISSAWSTGTRPALWSTSAITRLTQVAADDPLSNRAPYFAFLHVADQGNLEEAQMWMDQLLEKIDEVPLLLQPQYRLMNAWLHARLGKPDEARKIFATAQGGLTDKCEIVMVEAVILNAEGRSEEARHRARESLDLVASSMMPDAQSFARHQCESILG